MTQKSWPWDTATGLGDGGAELNEALTREFLATYFGVQDPEVEGVCKGLSIGELEVSGAASPLSVDPGAGICYGLYISDDTETLAVSTPAVGTTGGRVVLQTNWAGTGGASLEARTRLAVIMSADNDPSIPALTQAFGTTWEISLATFTITTGGVITVTDDRTFRRSTAVIDTDEILDNAVTPAKIANRTRKLFILPIKRRYTTATDQVLVPGGYLADGATTPDTDFYGFFIVPNDFTSGMTVKAVVVPGGSGDIYAIHNIKYGQVGEVYTTHTATVGYSAIAVTLNQFNAILSLSLASAAPGDIVLLEFSRDAVDVLDTVNTFAYLTGWLVEYTADS